MRPNWVWPSPQPITPAAVAAEKQAASLTAPRLAPPIISIHFLVQSSILLGHVQVGGVGCLSVNVRGWGQGGHCSVGTELQFYKTKRVLRMDSGHGCPTV